MARAHRHHQSAPPVEVATPDLVVVVTDLDGQITVYVAGELDLSNAAQLRGPLNEVLGAATPPSRRVVIELGGLTFIDSTGLGVLAGAARRYRQADVTLVVRSAGPVIRKVLDLSGVAALIELEHDEGDGSSPGGVR